MGGACSNASSALFPSQVIDTTESTMVDSVVSISAPRFNTDRNPASGCHGDQPVRLAGRLSDVRHPLVVMVTGPDQNPDD